MSENPNISLVAASLCGSIYESSIQTTRDLPKASLSHTTPTVPGDEQVKQHVDLYFKILKEIKSRLEIPSCRDLMNIVDSGS